MAKEKNNIPQKEEKRMTTITFNVSVENKKALKIYATEQETTISALMNGWIEGNCKGAKSNG